MLKIFFFFAIVIVVFIVYTKYLESRSVFFPAKDIEDTPGSIGLAFDDVYINIANGKITLHGWYIPCEGAKFTMVFCHGNGGNISHRLARIQLLHEIGVAVFIFDYRGYGKSSGNPSEEGIYQDIEAVYDFFVNERNVPPQQIILYGASLGSAVAINLAWREKIAALIVEGAFSSGKDMAKVLYPFIPNIVFFNKYDSMAKIKRIKVPKLFIHSRDDEIIPFPLGKKLYDAALAPKEFFVLEGSHNTAFLDFKDSYIASLKSFIEAL